MRTLGRIPVTDARGRFALLAHVLERGERKRRFLLQYPAGLRSAAHSLCLRTLLGVSLDDVQALDRRHARFRKHGLDHAALALLLAAADHDRVAFDDVHCHGFLQHLRRERGDLQKAAVAQLAHDRTEDARAARIQIVFVALDDDARVVVRLHDRAVRAANRRGGAHDHGLDDLAFLDRRSRNSALHRPDDDVADVRVRVTAAAAYVNDEQLARARVIGYLEPRLLLDHFARSTISTKRQRFCFDSGRHSMMRTMSPVLASLLSSCALNFTDLRTILPYTGCGTRVSETTTIVLSILSETTRPCLVRR